MAFHFNIKNPEYLDCFERVDKAKQVAVYRFIESLLYTTNGSNPGMDIDAIISLASTPVCSAVATRKPAPKRRNIKDSMIENYVIRNNKGQDFLKQLNVKLFLKSLCPKDIHIEDGEISMIVLPTK
jgi:hypothetical protein